MLLTVWLQGGVPIRCYHDTVLYNDGTYRTKVNHMNIPDHVTLPMMTDANGVIRISGSRVTLDTIIARYKQGDTPEEIHEGFDVVPLSDVYAVIGYYLSHRETVDDYLEANEKEGERIRAEIEARQGKPPTKAELLARLEAKRAQETKG